MADLDAFNILRQMKPLTVAIVGPSGVPTQCTQLLDLVTRRQRGHKHLGENGRLTDLIVRSR